MEEKKTFKVTAGDIEEALKQGFPITCATCVHFYAACAQGLPSCGKTECGGPVVGRDFPDYQGQIAREKFSEICLLCGDSNIRYKVVVGGKPRFALCEQHKSAFSGVVPDLETALHRSPPIIIPIL